MVGYITPGLTDPDYPAVRVLGMLLGGGMSGRLFTELRDRRGLAYQVGVQGTYRTGPSFLLTYMGTAPANVEASEKGVLAEIERIRTEPVTERELARAKAYLLGNLTMDRRTTASDAWYLAFFEVTGAGWTFPERYARAVEAVTTADVARVAQRYLTGADRGGAASRRPRASGRDPAQGRRAEPEHAVRDVRADRAERPGVPVSVLAEPRRARPRGRGVRVVHHGVWRRAVPADRRVRDGGSIPASRGDDLQLDVPARRTCSTCWATCCTCGSSATTSRTAWGTAGSWSSTWPAGLAAAPGPGAGEPDLPRCRWSAPAARSRACSAPTCSCFPAPRF